MPLSSIKIVHFSDWHDNWLDLPEADIYVCTGDMLPNYPRTLSSNEILNGKSRIIPAKEIANQNKWYNTNYRAKKQSLRKYLGSPEAPVVLVRGNHDFIDLGPLFGGEYFEVNLQPNRSKVYFGLKFGGFRGVPPISKEWSDEMPEPLLEKTISSLPNDLDIIISHTPPQGILDKHMNINFGSKAYRSYLNKLYYQKEKMPKAVLFGHIHECKMVLNTCSLQETTFSNAATGVNILHINKEI